MEIDLHQLPIPDWNLHCPQCNYPLRGLSKHRCPECGNAFEIEELIQTWTRLREPRWSGMELPFPDFGLHCGSCREPLAGATHRACPACNTAFDPAAFVPREDWCALERNVYGALTSLGVAALLLQEYVPYLMVNGQSPGETFLGLSRPPAVRIPREFFLEALWLLRRAAEQLTAVKSQPRWICALCASPNPANFDLCWKCDGPRSDHVPIVA